MPSLYYPRCHALLGVVFDGRGIPDSRPLVVEARPLSATVHFNGYSEADTWSAEFDARVLPFDPDILRSVAIRLYLYNADGLNDARPWAREEYLAIVGLADSVDLELTESGRIVRMEGRDYTGLLLDREWDPRERVPAGKPLSTTIQSIVDDGIVTPAGAPARVLRVDFESDDEDPIVGTRHRTTKKKGFHVKPGKSYWDLIYDMAIRHGYIVYIEGERVVITEPRVQTAASLAQAPVLVYGRNLGSLNISRRLAKEKVPQVRATSVDPRTGRVISAVYPATSSSPTTAIGTQKNEILRVTAPAGITDRRTLERFARTVYENKARSEATYSWQTMHLQDLTGQDLLRLRAGSPVVFDWDAFNREETRQLSAAERYEHMVRLGYSDQVASFVARRAEVLNLNRQAYYVKSAELSITAEGGLVVSSECVNYAFVDREEENQR